jgi:DNA-binding HxlR family transcriptional regulator
MKNIYGQFCPVAVACETFAERWTPLILRELILGSRRFNDIHRGVPKMSRTLLAQRLRELAAAGVVSSTGADYALTASGAELGEVVVRLGEWGQRWASPVRRDRLDPRVLMWDMRRRIAVERLPQERVVARFDFRAVPPASRKTSTFWLLLERPEADLCVTDPGFEVDVFVEADLASFARVWLGQVPMREAMRSGAIRLAGDTQAVRAFPSWLLLSTLAAVPRPQPGEFERRVA